MDYYYIYIYIYSILLWITTLSIYIYIISCYGLLLYIYRESFWLIVLIYLASYSTLRPVLTSIKHRHEPFTPVAAARQGQSLKVVSHCTCTDPQRFLDAGSGPETNIRLLWSIGWIDIEH